ncbi:MAG: tRNA dihydrouridine synthase DusB [Beijerinckiaceae bacterium]|nr:tRNA dihydrouridine synthase DusB [Beijerinckiaceae bacterium]
MVAYLSIGRHALPGRAVLAPMSGVTDHAFRQIAEDFGAGMVVSEMVAADRLAAGEEEARLRAEGRGLRLHVVQLAGCTPDAMAAGARMAEASGADIIDINMGCPAKRVVNGWSGSALMRDLDHAESLIAAVKNVVSVPVTLKMRLGWDHASLNAPELARRAEDHGLSLITVHGRTRQQFYKGQADWRAVQRVREAISLPLLVNGDIETAEQAREALRLSGADGVMIGRASLGRPWLVGEIAAALDGREKPQFTPESLAEAALRHYDSLLSSMGEAHGIRHARKHVAAYAEEAERRGAMIDPARKATALVAQDADITREFLRACFLAIPIHPIREAA